MLRECDLNEVTDGKKYTITDMVKADCGGCNGCSACCQGMGNSIVLDPLDFHRISSCLGLPFETLLGDKIELNIVDGIILPNLRMMPDKNDTCVFLDEGQRCSIHPSRPGICRIFPLGRLYEDNSFSYILQIHECKKETRTKVKISKWIDTPDLKQNQKFISDWHYFLKDVQQFLLQKQDDDLIKKVTLLILQNFYVEPYHAEEDFYAQFAKRLAQNRNIIFQNSTERKNTK